FTHAPSSFERTLRALVKLHKQTGTDIVGRPRMYSGWGLLKSGKENMLCDFSEFKKDLEAKEKEAIDQLMNLAKDLDKSKKEKNITEAITEDNEDTTTSPSTNDNPEDVSSP